ncbi:hypothetical protein PENTCL1PPCAC_29906, partial [Pristionchus entomophagus]
SQSTMNRYIGGCGENERQRVRDHWYTEVRGGGEGTSDGGSLTLASDDDDVERLGHHGFSVRGDYVQIFHPGGGASIWATAEIGNEWRDLHLSVREVPGAGLPEVDELWKPLTRRLEKVHGACRGREDAQKGKDEEGLHR